MDLTKIRLVAADMDGTLLNAQHELSPEFFPVFDKMKERKIWFAAASGRQYYNLLNKFNDIKDDTIFIAENGSYVVFQGKELLVQAMSRDIAMEQLQKCLSIPGTYPILCGTKRAYVQNTDQEFIRNVQMYYDEYVVVDNILNVEGDAFLKIAIYDTIGSEANSYPFFKSEQDHLQVKVSGKVWLDLSDKLANKGMAMEVIQKRYGITYDETMVFGDYLNDFELMQSGAFSFAMENAHDEIKRVSKYLAKSNDDNGVVIILQKMLEQMYASVHSGESVV